MTEPDETPVDLAVIAGDADVRAARIASRVAERVTAARRSGVVDHLARFALPAVLAAAASIALAATLPAARPAPSPGSMVARLMSGDRPVSFAELVAMTEENR